MSKPTQKEIDKLIKGCIHELHVKYGFPETMSDPINGEYHENIVQTLTEQLDHKMSISLNIIAPERVGETYLLKSYGVKLSPRDMENVLRILDLYKKRLNNEQNNT